MTTIAWDGRYLAADTLGTCGSDWCCQNHVHKLFTDAMDSYGRGQLPYAYAITGRAAYDRPWHAWYHEHAADPAHIPVGAGEGDWFIVVGKGLPCQQVNGGTPYLVEVDRLDGWGSGAKFAMGAMLHGATAPEAVAVGIKACTGSGGVVEYVDTQADAWAVQTWDPALEVYYVGKLPDFTKVDRVVDRKRPEYQGLAVLKKEGEIVPRFGPIPETMTDVIEAFGLKVSKTAEDAGAVSHVTGDDGKMYPVITVTGQGKSRVDAMSDLRVNLYWCLANNTDLQPGMVFMSVKKPILRDDYDLVSDKSLFRSEMRFALLPWIVVPDVPAPTS